MTEIIRGAEPMGERVAAVAALPDYKLDLTFTNGERRIYDVAPLLDMPAYRPLKSAALFATAHVAYGTVCWTGDIDFCPELLYRDGKTVN